MSISVALNHRTEYRYDRLVTVSPQVIRLRPAPHARNPITGYSLSVEPKPNFLNWQQDPQGNWQARVVFPEKVRHFSIVVDLVTRLDVFNPFDFFLDEPAETVPIEYPGELSSELAPFLKTRKQGPLFQDLLSGIEQNGQRTVDFLVAINQAVHKLVNYTIRMEPGVYSPEESLERGIGSCRDSAWLMVQLLRHLGLAARFVSGYLIQLKADQEALDGPSGAVEDFTDLHAWAEVYVPGGGWIGLDPTSGLFAGEGHIPLAATPDPGSAAPVTGMTESCEVSFEHHMSVRRVLETPRVTKPYNDEQWTQIDTLGEQVDADIKAQDMRLTMGGEPTFVSIDDMEADEWNTAAVGPQKQRLAADLARRLKRHYADKGLLTFGQGKWYPGESLPRWAYNIIWRTDGLPIWHDRAPLELTADGEPLSIDDAQRMMQTLTSKLGIDRNCVLPAYEDALHYMAEESRLPAGTRVTDADIDDAEKRATLARVFSRPLSEARALVLPIQRWQSRARPGWVSERWKLRREKLFLIPGDSAAGLRLPLESLPGGKAGPGIRQVIPDDPMAPRPPLPPRLVPPPTDPAPRSDQKLKAQAGIRTALVIEPRDGLLSVFMPPTANAADYLELVERVEEAAATAGCPVRIEGYPPPRDPRLTHIAITPDPGVIEVNIHPSANWAALRDKTLDLYEQARQARLGTNKFMIDGKHTGTGGGNHIVVGGPSAADSPFLRRPDLLSSVIRYWQNHPSLSYLFAGAFIGPTSQSPRVDEARDDALYELDIALSEVPARGQEIPLWLVDRIFRNLLVDLSGNTHRAEICIDKLYSPDSSTGRLGLVEFRAFEMPPHAQMSLAQQLLVRALLAWFWREPYRRPLRSWGTRLHDEMLLPYYLNRDLQQVITDLNEAGYEFRPEWFAAHSEFRFPHYGQARVAGQTLSVRGALECWPTMGEEAGGGGTARYVDSSLERVQIMVGGFNAERYVLACNGRHVPLQPTDTDGVHVAGVRFRAWQPWSCLHPTVPAHNPLVFDMVDTWNGRSVGGCSYHVHHPGGLSYEGFPINENEAESRRLARFFDFGHTPGPMTTPAPEHNPKHPTTLDLRRQPQEIL